MQVTPMRRSTMVAHAMVLMVMTVAGAVGCALPLEVDPAQGNQPPLLTALPRPLSATEVKVRDAVNDFSFALFSTVSSAQKLENTFISPLSASVALGMTMNGAANQTFSEMNAALRLSGLAQPEINSGFKSLTELLLSLDKSVDVKIANSIWYRNNFTFNQPFFDSTTKYFGATVKPLNFADQVASLTAINGWVKTATNDRIQKVLDRIEPQDVMFLMNAIYFKGGWREKFDDRYTNNHAFGALTGEQQTVLFMAIASDMQYAETPAYQAVDLPYGNGAFSMTVVVPRAGTDIQTLALSFNATSWKALTNALRPTPVNFAMPRLRLNYERTLTSDLRTLGMNVPFNEQLADFSRMTPASVFISFVKQNSFVEVNELGTEAAAVTTTGVGTTSAPDRKMVIADSPYMFVIRERLTGTVMFMARIVRVPS